MEKKPFRKLENLAEFPLGCGECFVPLSQWPEDQWVPTPRTPSWQLLWVLALWGLLASWQQSKLLPSAGRHRGPQFPLSPAMGTNTDVRLLRVMQRPDSPFTSRCCKVRVVLLLQKYPSFMSCSGSWWRRSPDLEETVVIRYVCHIEVVLLSRPSWMLIQQLTTTEHFCVTCWMNLHVNCRPIALPLKFLEVLHNEWFQW